MPGTRVVIVDNDGKRHVFPAGFDPKKASEIVRKRVPATPVEPPAAPAQSETWSDSLGLNAPTSSPIAGFFRGAGAGAVDAMQGAVSTITGQLNAKLDDENEGRREAGLTKTATLPRVETPDNFSGTVGSLLPTAAEIAVTGRAGTNAVAKAIPTTAKAGQKFQSVMGAAKSVPVDVEGLGAVALRINQLAERGGAMPMAVRKLLHRITDPSKAVMTYEESRDFASNISRLSANEFGRLTPAVAREVANLRVALNHANAMAAKQVGKLDEYNAAMLEYARAMRIKNVVNAAIEGAKKGAPYATAIGAGTWLGTKFAALIEP